MDQCRLRVRCGIVLGFPGRTALGSRSGLDVHGIVEKTGTIAVDTVTVGKSKIGFWHFAG